MSRISNLSNLRIPHFSTWKTTWYETSKYYSFLFYRDFQLHQYLKGLFYRLKMLTDDFYFHNLTQKNLFLRVNVYLYKFQIKKYFLSFFFDQYLLYNFFLKKRKYYFTFYSNFSIHFFSLFSLYLREKNIYFFFNLFYFFREIKNVNFLFRKKYIKSILKLNDEQKYNINPIKLKLKSNLSYFFRFYNKENVLKRFFCYKFYVYYLLLQNLLYFSLLFNYNHVLFLFFSIFVSKKNLLNNVILHFFTLNKKNELSFLYSLKENYRRELSRDIFDDRTYYDYFFSFFLYYFILNVEKSIFLFTGNRCLFFPTFYYYKKFPSFLSAKLVNDYVLLELEKGNNLYRIFKMLQTYQLREKNKLKQELLVDFNRELFFKYFNKRKILISNKLESYKGLNKKIKSKYINLFKKNKQVFFSSYLKIRTLFEDLYYNEVLSKKYPLIGIRIECNGPPKRGRQARLVAYHQIVKNYKLFGKMPNKSILADIDYSQSFARTKQGSIGIKVWIFFYSKTYDSNYKLISIV